MKQYYYFKTSLPEITLDLEKLPISVVELILNAREELIPYDFNFLRSILFQYDNQNLVNYLEKIEEFDNLSIYSKDELIEESKLPLILPNYMISFLDDFKSEDREYKNYSLIDTISLYYYNYMIKSSSSFIKNYFEFEMNLKNFLVALNCRKYSLPSENRVLYLNSESELLFNNNTADFGLSVHYDWSSKVVVYFNECNIVEREDKIDRLKFHVIDNLLEFEEFNVNNILGYLVKLTILDRRLKRDFERGKSIFKNSTDTLSDDKHVFAESFQ